MSVFRGSDQSRETRGGIEVRKAKPVDRTLLGDQCGCVAVADHGVIFDGNRQDLPSAKIEIELTRAPKLVLEAPTTLPGLPPVTIARPTSPIFSHRDLCARNGDGWGGFRSGSGVRTFMPDQQRQPGKQKAPPGIINYIDLAGIKAGLEGCKRNI